jgi:hypothetical protein
MLAHNGVHSRRDDHLVWAVGSITRTIRSLHHDRDEEYRILAAYIKDWSYGARMDWEQSQLKKLKSLPLLGSALYYFAKRILKKWTDAKLVNP